MSAGSSIFTEWLAHSTLENGLCSFIRRVRVYTSEGVGRISEHKGRTMLRVSSALNLSIAMS